MLIAVGIVMQLPEGTALETNDEQRDNLCSILCQETYLLFLLILCTGMLNNQK